MFDRWLAPLREHAQWLLVGLAAIVLIVHSLAYDFVTDDAYISFVYSRNFAEHGELAFNLGDPVEGYTNFLWTVLLGALMVVGAPPEITSRVLGTACAIVTLVLVARIMQRALGRKSAWAAIPPLLLATSSGFACWTSGGLETQLFTMLVTGALEAVVASTQDSRSLRRAAICIALAAMTRPEGPLVAAVLGAAWVIHRLVMRSSLPPRPRPLQPWLVRGLVVASAIVLAGFLVQVATLAIRIATVDWISGRGTIAIALVLFAITIAVGLYHAWRAVRGNVRSLAACGAVLVILGGVAMIVAIRYQPAGGSWDYLVPVALSAAIFGATCLGAAIVIAPPRVIADELLASVWFLGLWGPWFAWRWWYYGYPFPNTYYVKASGEWTNAAYASQMLDQGRYYVWVWLQQTRLVYVLPIATLGLIAIRPRTPRFVLGLACALLAIVYIPYTISVGGDFMGLHRFIMPMFVVAAIALVLGLEWIVSKLSHERTIGAWVVFGMLALALAVALLAIVVAWQPSLRHGAVVIVPVGFAIALAFTLDPRRWLAPLACLVVLAVFAITQAELTRRSLDPKNLTADRGVIDTPAFLIVYTEDRAKIGRAMEPCFRDDDFSIVGGAGAQPYFGRMRGIDVFGLVSDRIAHHSPRSRARAGHTKWGAEPVLATYDPTFVFSCYAIHRTAAQPQLPCAGFWRARGFEPVTMKIPGMQQQGEYYTFLAKKARNFQCPGRVR